MACAGRLPVLHGASAGPCPADPLLRLRRRRRPSRRTERRDRHDERELQRVRPRQSGSSREHRFFGSAPLVQGRQRLRSPHAGHRRLDALRRFDRHSAGSDPRTATPRERGHGPGARGRRHCAGIARRRICSERCPRRGRARRSSARELKRLVPRLPRTIIGRPHGRCRSARPELASAIVSL